MTARGPVIAIDGPAASGKGTIGRALARHFGFAHLDTGAIYRAVGHAVRAAGQDPADPAAAEAAARALVPGQLDDPALRGEAAGAAASVVAAIPGVRAALLDFQRDFAAHPPGGAPGAVLDGRDIGTVVCPDADLKLFVTAAAETRAHRRHLELLRRGDQLTEAEVLSDIRARDARDAGRASAPLARADDARLLDTTEMDIDSAVAEAIRLTEEALRARGRPGPGRV